MVEHISWDINLSGIASTNILKNYYDSVLSKKHYFEGLAIDEMGENNYSSLGLKERMNKIVEVIKEGNSSRPAVTKQTKKYFQKQVALFKEKYGTELEVNNDEFEGNITNITSADEDN